MTFVIITGGIDLSVGSIVALVNALAAIALRAGLPWPLAVAAAARAGGCDRPDRGLVRCLSGDSVLHRHARGAVGPARDRTAADPGLLHPDRRRAPGSTRSAAARSLACRCRRRSRCWSRSSASSRSGRRATAGRWSRSAPMRKRRGGSGMPARRVAASVFALTGIAAALAGLIIAARLGSGSSNAAVGFELDVIAAVVLGGTSLFGGRGSIVGTVLGRADHRRDRQWADPAARLAVLHADRHRRDHPGRDLAEHARVRAAAAPRRRVRCAWPRDRRRTRMSRGHDGGTAHTHIGSGQVMTVRGRSRPRHSASR